VFLTNFFYQKACGLCFLLIAMKNALTNLHKQLGGENSLINNIREKVGQISEKISEHFPDILTQANAIGQNLHLKKLKSKVMQRLEKKRKKFGLALEKLGWGKLAALLEAAFCGEKLDLWV
jgi:imidazoleglycerol phosphate dehydratase HisB